MHFIFSCCSSISNVLLRRRWRWASLHLFFSFVPGTFISNWARFHRDAGLKAKAGHPLVNPQAKSRGPWNVLPTFLSIFYNSLPLGQHPFRCKIYCAMDNLVSRRDFQIREEEKYTNAGAALEKWSVFLLFCAAAKVHVRLDQELLRGCEKANLNKIRWQQTATAFETSLSISAGRVLFWSNLEQITVAPNGRRGSLLQRGDKSLCAGLAWRPAGVCQAMRRPEIRQPPMTHLPFLYLMKSGQSGPTLRGCQNWQKLVEKSLLKTHNLGVI